MLDSFPPYSFLPYSFPSHLIAPSSQPNDSFRGGTCPKEGGCGDGEGTASPGASLPTGAPWGQPCDRTVTAPAPLGLHFPFQHDFLGAGTRDEVGFGYEPGGLQLSATPQSQESASGSASCPPTPRWWVPRGQVVGAVHPRVPQPSGHRAGPAAGGVPRSPGWQRGALGAGSTRPLCLGLRRCHRQVSIGLATSCSCSPCPVPGTSSLGSVGKPAGPPPLLGVPQQPAGSWRGRDGAFCAPCPSPVPCAQCPCPIPIPMPCPHVPGAAHSHTPIPYWCPCPIPIPMPMSCASARFPCPIPIPMPHPHPHGCSPAPPALPQPPARAGCRPPVIPVPTSRGDW